MNKKQEHKLRELQAIVKEHFPAGYDATEDRVAAPEDHALAVNALGRGLRDAIGLLLDIKEGSS